MKKAIKSLFNLLGIEILRRDAYQKNMLAQKKNLDHTSRYVESSKRLFKIIADHKLSSNNHELEFLTFLSSKIEESKSQIFQDLFVLFSLNEKRDGFFVEFGAADGEIYSNTLLLEQAYGWKGILCEPGQIWRHKLLANRKCQVDFRCVWRKSGECLQFNETTTPELSTLKVFNDSDFHSKRREGGKLYSVETVSLLDLLIQHNAPATIDYLSLDTEGSEFDILSEFDFTRYRINVLSIEHNFTPAREKVNELLTQNGFKRVFSSVSSFDDWYVVDDSSTKNSA